MGKLQHVCGVRRPHAGTTIFFLIAIVTGIGFSHRTCAQQFELLASVALPSSVHSAHIDRVGELYLIYENGLIERRGINGEVLASIKEDTLPTLFDPRDGAHLFFYWGHERKYEFRLSDLQPRQRILLDSSLAIHPYLVCPAGEKDISILDSADWSLKRLNLPKQRVTSETIILDTAKEGDYIVSMRDYQGFTFTLDKEGKISAFDLVGRRIKGIRTQQAPYFNFLGEEIYFPSASNQLRFVDLFTREERQIRLPANFYFAILSDERVFLINENILTVYSTKS